MVETGSSGDGRPWPSVSGKVDETLNLEGRVIGHIRVEKLLGEGGMGRVYLGTDEALRRRVALKVIRPDRHLNPLARKRFLAEARALGQLEHPNICRIHELLETEGAGIIVLEYVDGITLGEALQRGLTFQEKLGIAIQIAEGLAAAHSMSIVHRDLKPDNVMVTPEGVVRIMDFGLARTLDPDVEGERSTGCEAGRPDTAATRLGRIVGTLRYMSPEQAQGLPATAASDMFSFGLVLHELFTGERPYGEGLSFDALLRKVQWADLRPPSGIPRALRDLVRELESLEPGRRPSAPVVLERLRAIRDRPRRLRTRAALTAAWVTVLLFGVGMTVESRRAAREAERAEREAAASRQVSSFLESLFHVADPDESRGNTVTAREILDRGAERIGRELENQPEIRHRLMTTIGRVYRELGLYEKARTILEKVVQEGGENGPPAAALAALAGVARDQGSYDEAERIGSRAVAVYREAGDRKSVARELTSLASLHDSMGRYDQGLAEVGEALQIYRSLPGGQVPSDTYQVQGILLRDAGRCEEAVAPLERALELDRRQLGADHPDYASSLESLASVYYCLDRYADADPLCREAVAIYEKTLGPDHPHLALSLNTLAAIELKEGRPGDAEATLRKVVGIYVRGLGPDHPHVGVAMENLGAAVWESGRREEAVAIIRKAVAIEERGLGPDHPGVAAGLAHLAGRLAELERFDEAGALYRRALGIEEAALDPGSEALERTRRRYAALLRRQGREDEAKAVEEGITKPSGATR
ncbi:MAG TPA: serine/threonine protein kinase [Acidobacteria bacterium]|nr:serine/threonine protein kinase [Acidobacteriota bacterium]